jgi:ABC-type thiamine transport system ATPase subunit
MTVADGIARLGLNARLRLNTPSAKSAAALIAAILPDAAIVVLHDPFRDLSDDIRAKSIEWIRSLAESGTSVLITGTSERDVRSVSHSVIEIGAGR